MYLTREEERILNGEYGETRALALRVIVKVGEAFNADSLIDIVHAHISGVSYFNIGDHGLKFIEDLALKGAKSLVFTTANPYAAIYATYLSNDNRFSDDIIEKQLRIIKALKNIGAKAFTCAPYYIRKPGRGEHLAWAESNAVLYANSVCGAKTNREGGPLALLEAIAGKTYNSGMHKEENRVPQLLINVPSMKGYTSLAVLGYLIGKASRSQIPYVRGIKDVNDSEIRAFLAAFGTSSGAPMVIIEGITPNYKQLLAKADNLQQITISRSEIEEFIIEGKMYRKGGRGLYILGCPHLTIKELIEVIEYLNKRTKAVSGISRSSELWLITHSGFLAEINELKKFIKLNNVKILTDICPVVTRLDLLGVDYVVTNSVKGYVYISKMNNVQTYLMGTFELLNDFLESVNA
jgi:hypothetical protein